MVEIAVFDGDERVEQIRRRLIEFDQNPVFEILRIQAADHQGLKPCDSQLGTIGGGQFSDVIAGEAHMDLLGRISAFIKLETTGVEVNGVAIDRSSARPIGHAFAAIAQRIELQKEVIA